MDYERLDDYTQKEKEAWFRFARDFSKNQGGKFPPAARFPKLSEPLALSHPSNIWTKIPMYGSTVVNLAPLPQDVLVKRYGWGTNRDILNLVDLAKETGRVHFRLTSQPDNYLGLDYLDPILEDLRPPCTFNLSRLLFEDNEVFKTAYAEFVAIAQISFVPMLEKLYPSLGYRNKRMDDYATDFAILKTIGYSEVAEQILNLMIDDPNTASYLFTIYGNLVASPTVDTMLVTYKSTLCEDRADYERQIRTLADSGQPLPQTIGSSILPSDIGRLLTTKLSFGSKGYNGCMALIDRYKEHDFYGLVSAIQSGCQDGKLDLVTTGIREMEEVLDQIWNKADDISRTAEILSYGVLISVGLIGALAIMPIGGLGGLLAGLGFSVVEKHISPVISSRTSRLFYPKWMVTVYDFKTRYQVPMQ